MSKAKTDRMLYQEEYRKTNREVLMARKKTAYAKKRIAEGKTVRKSKKEREALEAIAQAETKKIARERVVRKAPMAKKDRAEYHRNYYKSVVLARQPVVEKIVPEEADLPDVIDNSQLYIDKIDSIYAKLETISPFGIEREELEREINILEYKLQNCNKQRQNGFD